MLEEQASMFCMINQGNQAPFMTKEQNNQIMKRSKSKNLYFKWFSREHFLTYKNEK